MAKKLILLGLILAMFSISCGDAVTENPEYGRAKDFELTDINGNNVKLSDHAGKVIILNFFATWCPPCREEMPDFEDISKEYEGSVEVIAVNVGRENAGTVRGFVDKHGLTFTVALDDGNASALYGPIRAIPVTVVIDKDFNIARKYIGMRTKEVFLRDIEELS